MIGRRPRSRRVRTPTVLQMEHTECGAAALAIVLGAFGRFVPLPELRTACGVTRDGSTAINILRAARGYGLIAKGYRKDLDELSSVSLPCIAFWKFNHFVVVEGFDQRQVYLNDPATGPRTATHEEFDRAYTGVILTFTPGPDFQQGGSRPRLLGSLRRLLDGSEAGASYLILATLACSVPGLLVPVFLQLFIDNYLIGDQHQWLEPLLIGLAVATVLGAALTWLQRQCLVRLETRLALRTSGQMLWHLLRLPIEFYHQRLTSEIGTRVTLNDRLARVVSGELAIALLNVITVALYAALMAWYDRPLTLISLALAAANLAILVRVGRLREDSRRRLLEARGRLFGTSVAGLRMIESLKVAGGESDFFARWAGLQASIANAEQELGVATQPLLVFPSLLAAINMIAVLTIGGLQVIDGQLSLGMLAAFQSLAVGMMLPVNRLVRLGGLLQEVNGDWERLNDVFLQTPDRQAATKPSESDGPSPLLGPASQLTGHVELRSVSFGYDRLAPPLIADFNLALAPGARVALVGSTGSGKSTIARLVAGLYEPWAGEILFDGQPRDQIARARFTHSLATVDQEIFLFDGTVRENLTLWDSSVPTADLVGAARDACIYDVIASRPGGFEGPVAEDGRNFSGGERQRLEIARALVRNPRVVILDEATSALDPITEQEIDRNLRRRGCACLIIAHRLSTIRDCEEILVLERGKVVQRGTHDALIACDGAYARLIRAEMVERRGPADRQGTGPVRPHPEPLAAGEGTGSAVRLAAEAPVARGLVPSPADAVGDESPRYRAGRTGDTDSVGQGVVGRPGGGACLLPDPCLAQGGERARDKLPPRSRLNARPYASLAGLPRGKEGSAPANTGLLRACALVGAAQGIEIRGPTGVAAGDSLDPVEAIARASGVRARPVTLRPAWQHAEAGPLLGFLTDGERPVALLAGPRGRYFLVNPDSAQRTPVSADGAPELRPTAYQFYRSFPRRAVSARELLSFGLRGSRGDLLAALLLGLAGGALALLVPVAFARIVGAIIPIGARGQLLQLAAVLVVVVLATALFDFARGIALLRIETRLENTLQAAVWDRLLDLPVHFLRSYTAGDLANRALGIIGIRRALTNTVVTSVLGVIFSVFSLGLLFYFDVALALLACALLVTTLAITFLLSRALLPFERLLYHLQGNLAGLVPQLLGGIAKLRVAGAEARAFRHWAADYANQRETSFELGRLTSWLSVTDAVMPIVATGAILGLVAWRAPAMPIGTLLGFYAAFASLLTAMLQMSTAWTSALPTVPVYERLKPILAALPEATARHQEPGVLSGSIEICGASFRYAPDSPLALDGVSLRCAPGEFVAIVGPSGSGKSTLLRLMLGFEHPECGTVRLDGNDLASVDARAVRRQIGVVLQNGKLLPGDVFTNIVGAARLTRDDAWRAARLAGLAEDIERLPMGMHTVVVEDGATFSAGQRQRLMIARAVATRPRILLFDEATSALDNRTQDLVSQSLKQLDATRIVIAQRLSTIAGADRIYVLRDGRVVQTGTYAELMNQPGTFADLARRQLS